MWQKVSWPGTFCRKLTLLSLHKALDEASLRASWTKARNTGWVEHKACPGCCGSPGTVDIQGQKFSYSGCPSCTLYETEWHSWPYLWVQQHALLLL